tara:strand:+ start:143 stop:460 length:318 start_codon:yes stop_codon:yes gene_type:complete
MKTDFDKMTRKFLMGEGKQDVNPHALLQALNETISSIKPRSLRDRNKIAIAKKHLHEITRSFRRLQEQVNILEEKLQVLEEVSSVGGGNLAGFAGVIGTKEEDND